MNAEQTSNNIESVVESEPKAGFVDKVFRTFGWGAAIALVVGAMVGLSLLSDFIQEYTQPDVQEPPVSSEIGAK